MIDTIIIGKGPAGVSAALYIKRAGFNVKIIGKDGGALEKAEKIENYYGLENPVSGIELINIGLNQARDLDIEIIDDEVTSLEYFDKFYISLANGERIEAKSVLLATGSVRKNVKIKGINEFEGSGVSYCAVCDAFFYRGKDIAIFGNGDYALHECNELINIAKSVTILTNGHELNAKFPENVIVNKNKVVEIFGKDVVEGVLFEDNSIININGLFMALGNASALDLARKIGAEFNENKLNMYSNMKTSIDGLFAAGDCTGGVLQVSTAVGEGAKAGLGIIEYLRKEAKIIEK